MFGWPVGSETYIPWSDVRTVEAVTDRGAMLRITGGGHPIRIVQPSADAARYLVNELADLAVRWGRGPAR